MKIGVFSDTHNDMQATQRAAEIFRGRGIHILFHCGDITSADVLPHLKGFAVYVVRGNMDREHLKSLRRQAASQEGVHWLDKGDVVEVGGKRVAITHGDLETVCDKLLEEAPDYLLHGHTHRRRDERVDGTRVINPGALGGVQYESRSLCVLDLDTDDLDVIILD
jgi:putative phosphoesterase